MSQPTVKWGQLQTFLKCNNFQIYSSGGDKLIVKNGKVHRIGHKFCSHFGNKLPPAHLNALKRKFNITRNEILNK